MKVVIFLFLLLLAGAGPFLIHIPDTSSPEFHAWKERRSEDRRHQKDMEKVFLDPTFSFTGLELIEVGPGKVYYSLWGHVLLRFVGSGKSPEEDLVLSFLADFSDFPVHKWKASFGGYEVLPKLDTLKNYQQEYAVGEKRFMNSYLLKTSSHQNQKLKSILTDWVNDKSLPGTYTFVSNNCVGLMLKLFSSSGIISPEEARDSYFPKDIPNLLLSSQLISSEDHKKYAAK